MKNNRDGDEFVRACLAAIKKYIPGVTDEELTEFRRLIYEKFGGKSIYVGKRKLNLSNISMKGLTVIEIQKKYGVSQSHAYKLRNRDNKPKE